MRRWLLAVFVFQLFWSMAGFAIVGHAHEREPGGRPSVAVSLADVKATDGKGLVDLAHGLMDELPDLPDSLLRRSPPRALALKASADGRPLPHGLPPPLPVALYRPPPRA